MGKYSWKFLNQHIKNGMNDFVYERTPAITMAYQNQLDMLKNTYVNRGDHIRIEYMNWRPFQNAEGKIIAVSNNNSLQHVITYNKFPYDLRKGIYHKNIFSVIPLSADEINTKIKEDIGEDKEYIWFVNTPDNQSIPDLWHCHFFYH